MNPAEEYILNQSEPYKTIILHIQILVESSIPEIEMKYKYKIPFYYLGDKPFCYLNVSKGYVDVGFWKGNQISIHLDHLITDGRKIMKSLRYTDPKEINDKVFLEVLKNAQGLYH
ncbi:DUF1801 domain-containing protein [Aquimarina longa]|uniref:DUF1801 domain-containing protein n=1 Tax=Aquimarina longa TaxID=1080221 RepID=UPI00078385DC|nr:DUF1801 domain-containing protein [Aquimarina longa]